MSTEIHWLEHWLDHTVACGRDRDRTSNLEVADGAFLVFADGLALLRGPLEACPACVRNAKVAQAVRVKVAKRNGVVPCVLPPSGFQRNPEKDSVVAGSAISPGRPQAAGPEGMDP